jgi:hypothetical protein
MGLILGHHLAGGAGPSGLVAVGPVIVAPQTPTLLPPAPIEGPGDRLFALVSGTAGLPLTDGTWTTLNVPAGASFRLKTKIAAGNSTDDASVDGGIGNTVSVGVKFTFPDIPGPGSWDFNAQGSIVNSLQLTFITGQLNAFLSPKPSMSIYVGVRTAQGLNPASGPGVFSDSAWTIPPDGGVILKQKTQFFGVNPFTMWHACNFNFQPVQATYPSGKQWSDADQGVLHGTATRGWRYNHD